MRSTFAVWTKWDRAVEERQCRSGKKKSWGAEENNQGGGGRGRRVTPNEVWCMGKKEGILWEVTVRFARRGVFQTEGREGKNLRKRGEGRWRKNN